MNSELIPNSSVSSPDGWAVTVPLPTLASSAARRTGIDLSIREKRPINGRFVLLCAIKKETRRPALRTSEARISGSRNWLWCGATTKIMGPSRGIRHDERGWISRKNITTIKRRNTIVKSKRESVANKRARNSIRAANLTTNFGTI